MDDWLQICALKARYFRYLDTKDWDALAALFTADAEVDMSSEGSGVTVGPDAFVAMVRAAVEDVVTVHHGHMPEIELTGPDTARGVWAMEDRLWWPEGAPLRHVHGWGHYHETYRKGPDGWRIATMRLTRLRRDVELAP